MRETKKERDFWRIISGNVYAYEFKKKRRVSQINNGKNFKRRLRIILIYLFYYFN